MIDVIDNIKSMLVNPDNAEFIERILLSGMKFNGNKPITITMKSFKGHKGIPGHQGGSLARNETWQSGKTEAQKIKILTNGKLTPDSNVRYIKGITKSMICNVAGNGRVIIKGDDVLSSVLNPIAMVANEKLAYDVSVAMGFDRLVPTTVVRMLDEDIVEDISQSTGTHRNPVVYRKGNVVSMQEWIENSIAPYEIYHQQYSGTLPIPGAYAEGEFIKMGVLDSIIGNGDRHSNNSVFLVDQKTGEITNVYAIDHNLIRGLYNNTIDAVRRAKQSYSESSGKFNFDFVIPNSMCDTLREKCSTDGEIYNLFKSDGDTRYMMDRVDDLLRIYGDGKFLDRI
jgi:hypothetical protein